MQFDCVATCFFVDTCDDLIDYIETIDSVRPAQRLGFRVASMPADIAPARDEAGPGEGGMGENVTLCCGATMCQVLKEGGIWVNLGPLNYKKELKLKLAWEELQAVWESKNYSFVHSSRV